MQVSPDGQKVVLGGYFYYVNGEFSHSIAMLSSADSSEPNGTLLRTYPRGFIPGDPNATSPDANAPQGTPATHAITNGAGDGMFYIANEGLSILENAGRIGLPMPEALKGALVKLKDGKNDMAEGK